MKDVIAFAMLGSIIAVGFAATGGDEKEEGVVLTEAPSAQSSLAQPSTGFEKAFATGLAFAEAPGAVPEQGITIAPQGLAPLAQAGSEQTGEILLRRITRDDIARMKAAGIGTQSGLEAVQTSIAQ